MLTGVPWHPLDTPLHTEGGPVLRVVNLSKTFPPAASSGAEVRLFHELSVELRAGEMVAVVGRSGVGKSSLLHLLAGLERPTSGEVWLGTESITRLDASRAARMRNAAFGFVWQFHYLLPEFTAVENIAMPLMARGTTRKAALAEAETWLARVELTRRSGHRSGELSGGEQQRVAIARALITRPRILLADEPTGDLDETTASQLFLLLEKLCREGGLATIIVTHNLDLAYRCDRTLLLREGKLEPAPAIA